MIATIIATILVEQRAIVHAAEDAMFIVLQGAMQPVKAVVGILVPIPVMVVAKMNAVLLVVHVQALVLALVPEVVLEPWHYFKKYVY